jgi:hypothetical protein
VNIAILQVPIQFLKGSFPNGVPVVKNKRWENYTEYFIVYSILYFDFIVLKIT